MLSNDVLHELVADASGDERGDENVGIENDPHGSRRKTSSSVKMPWASA